MSLAIAATSAAPVRAQDCRASSYLPGLDPLILRNGNGATIALKRDSRHCLPTAHVWINGSYVVQQEIPFTLADGQIRVRLRTQQRLETWLGKVRQTYKSIPYVIVCGDWDGDLD